MPSFRYADVVKIIKKLGFVFLRQAKGSHEFWQNPKNGKLVLIMKHKKDFPTGTISKIAKDLDFKSLVEFEKLK